MPSLRSPALLALFTLLLVASGPIGCGDGSTATGVGGDGKVEGEEECDDGNKLSGDGCSPTCKNVSAPACGDGVIQLSLGEQCDDGNDVDADACTNDCLYATCGDGIIQEGLEVCDDGNQSSQDGCTNKCKVAVCGDGFVQEGVEQCDDANSNDGDSCRNNCAAARCGDGVLHEDVEDCDDGNTDDTDACSNTCRAPRCGDGIVQAGEQCDDDNLVDTDGCTNQCTFPVCGDGVVQRTEECDDGNEVDTDGCSNLCVKAVCGDGIVQIGEDCDDQNQVDDDACTNRCTLPFCGDGIVQAPEQCDDGNNVENDACTTVCENARCGDGFVGAGEQCDDGNNDDGDGCSAICRLPGCGDNILQAGEECDDGNANDTDACTSVCRVGRCGDGHVRAGVETCDDSNTVNTDGCTNACQLARCGDAIVQAGVEQCDDGNANDTDFCSNACMTPVCGNGVKEGLEQCDDGNSTRGDGCSSGCLDELLETEPNNTWQTANGPLATPTEIIGYIPVTPSGGTKDVDFFTFTATTYVDVRIETFALADNNANCTGVDTVVTLLDPNREQLAQNDDKVSTSRCSMIEATKDPGARRLAPGTYYVRVEAYGTSTIASGYRMEVRFTAVCGNGNKEGSEGCDDGNTNNSDSCNNACAPRPVCGDGRVVTPEECERVDSSDTSCTSCKFNVKEEIEPNNTTAAANTSGHPVITNQGRIKGAIGATGDKDFFKLVIAGTGTRVIYVQTWGATPYECPTTVDTALRLFNSSGQRMVTSDEDTPSSMADAEKRSDLDSGLNKCAALTYPLAPGTYYLQVERQGNSGTIATYHLDVNVTRYDSTLGPESEPNDNIADANLIYGVSAHTTGEITGFVDTTDTYKFTLTQAMSVHIEHIDNNKACKPGSDTGETELFLFDSNQVQLAYDDNSGRGSCARINGISGSHAGARNLLPGTYYVRLKNKAFATYTYRLVVWGR